MNESTLDMHVLQGDILVVSSEDTSDATLADWLDTMMKILDDIHAPAKHLYDMRRPKKLTLKAVRVAARLRKHPHVQYVYVAVVVPDTTTMTLVKVALSASGYGTFQFFTDMDEAVAWLNRQVPPANEPPETTKGK